jgi:MFS family permease
MPDPSHRPPSTDNETPESLGFFHPSKRPYRFTILMFISLLLLGSYFAYDSIGALAPTLIEALHLDRSTIGNLYTAYSVAAILIVFFGGMLYDKLGPRRASMLFCCLVLVGATIVAIAHSKWELFAGRLIFGAGAESLVVVQSAIISRWFKGKEMALAFGIALTVSVSEPSSASIPRNSSPTITAATARLSGPRPVSASSPYCATWSTGPWTSTAKRCSSFRNLTPATRSSSRISESSTPPSGS